MYIYIYTIHDIMYDVILINGMVYSCRATVPKKNEVAKLPHRMLTATERMHCSGRISCGSGFFEEESDLGSPIHETVQAIMIW